MPRAPEFTTTSISELFRQLSYAPRETRRRQLANAEALVEDLDPEQGYPEEFITYRITGYRSDAASAPVVMQGEAVLADLATFVQELSRTLDLESSSPTRGEALPLDAMAARLRITPRTLRRYRRRGLLLHYVSDGAGSGKRLSCYDRSLARFAARHPGLIDRASGFSRVDAEEIRTFIEEAMALQARKSWTRQKIARSLGRRHGRAVETMRTILARHERAVAEAVFGGRRRTSAWERRFMARAWSMGVGIGAIAAHLDRSELTVRRMINRWRVDRLLSVAPGWIELPTFELDDAEAVILSPIEVHEGLGPLGRHFDAVTLVESLKGDRHHGIRAEQPRLAACNLLKRRAWQRASGADQHPNDREVEAIERDLRWAMLLHRAMVFDALGQVLTRLEQNLGRPLIQQSVVEIPIILRLGVQCAGDVVASTNPAKGQSISRRLHHVIDRAFASSAIHVDTNRAGARHERDGLDLGDPMRDLTPWASIYEWPDRWTMFLPRISDQQQLVLRDTYGLNGVRPRTSTETAEHLGMSRRAVRNTRGSAQQVLRRLVTMQAEPSGD